MLLQPQEVEVYYLLPAIRKEFALALKRTGRAQKEIAQILGVTEAAVSQYCHSKRGQDVAFPQELSRKVEEAAGKVTDQQSMMREVQAILRAAKESRLTCRLHEQMAAVPHGCDACFREDT